jgi:hypothetical protein
MKDWEQGRTRPIGGVRAYLIIIERDPKAVIEILRTKVRPGIASRVVVPGDNRRWSSGRFGLYSRP